MTVIAYCFINSPGYADHEPHVDSYLEASLKRLVRAQWRNQAGNLVGISLETRCRAAKTVIFPCATSLNEDSNIKYVIQFSRSKRHVPDFKGDTRKAEGTLYGVK